METAGLIVGILGLFAGVVGAYVSIKTLSKVKSNEAALAEYKNEITLLRKARKNQKALDTLAESLFQQVKRVINLVYKGENVESFTVERELHMIIGTVKTLITKYKPSLEDAGITKEDIDTFEEFEELIDGISLKTMTPEQVKAKTLGVLKRISLIEEGYGADYDL